MAAIEVTQEVAKAAKMFIGNSQEYCFLFIDWWPLCMTKSEWSGWMQVFGGLLTIIGAIWISTREQRLAKLSSMQVAISKTRIVHNGLIVIATNAANDKSLLFDEIEKMRFMAEEYLMISRSINSEVLSAKWNACIYSIRADAIRLISCLTQFANSPKTVRLDMGHPHYHRQMTAEARQVEISLAFCGEILSRPHPGVQEDSSSS